VDGTTVIQAAELNVIQDEVDACQEKIGVDGSAVTTSIDYKLNHFGIAQVQASQINTYLSGSTLMYIDDTIPQNTEGTQFMSVAITPKASANILLVEVLAHFYTVNNYQVIGALFRDSTASAVAAAIHDSPTYGYVPFHLRARITAGSTSATTFYFRAGAPVGSVYLNGHNTTRIFGGTMYSSITVTEIRV